MRSARKRTWPGKHLLYTSVRTTRLPTLLDPATGKRTELSESRTDLVFPRFSPAGDRIAFFHQDAEGVHVYTFNLEGKDLRQVTQGKQGINTMPAWPGDGAVLYFYQMRPKFSFRSVPVAGGASTEVAPWRWETQHDAQVDPQGRYVVYCLQESGRPPVTMLRDLNSGQEKAPGWRLSELSWSRDGRMVLGCLNTGEVAVCPAQGGGCTAWTKDYQPRWSGDGSAIYFLRAPQRATEPDLWRISLKDRRETKIGAIGPFQPIEIHYDVSLRDRLYITNIEKAGTSCGWRR